MKVIFKDGREGTVDFNDERRSYYQQLGLTEEQGNQTVCCIGGILRYSGDGFGAAPVARCPIHTNQKLKEVYCG